MSALRLSTPDGIQLIDLGPAHYQPLRGRATRSGHIVRPAPPIPRVKEPITDAARIERNAAQRRYRDGLR